MAERAKGAPRAGIRRAAGVAALAGGLCWTIKAVVVLAGGAQPDYITEFAPAAQGLAVAALSWALPSGVLTRMVALAALGAGAGAAFAYVSAPEHFLYNVAMFAATVLVILGLMLVGRTARKRAALGRWSRLPGRLGFWTLPLILAGGLLSSLNEKLIEVPVLLLGLAWLWLGVVLMADRTHGTKAERTENARPRSAPSRQPADAGRRR